MIAALLAFAIACGGTETVVVERVITQTPERVVETVDDESVLVNFPGPRPKFFYFMTYKFGIGVYIVPKHIFEGQDWLEFTNFDLEKGWPITTGPWEVTQTSPEQKLVNRRDSWWAVDHGLFE